MYLAVVIVAEPTLHVIIVPSGPAVTTLVPK